MLNFNELPKNYFLRDCTSAFYEEIINMLRHFIIFSVMIHPINEITWSSISDSMKMTHKLLLFISQPIVVESFYSNIHIATVQTAITKRSLWRWICIENKDTAGEFYLDSQTIEKKNYEQGVINSCKLKILKKLMR
jgi:hypothetical protein